MKRYGDTPVRISEKAAEAYKQALERGGESLEIGGASYKLKSIASVEPTTERVEENIYSAAEIKSYGKGEPVPAPNCEYNGITYENNVLSNWYKKNIDKKEWETYYSHQPGYFRIDASDKSIWVAFLLSEEKSSTKPRYLELCDKEEVEYLANISQ